MKQEEWAYIRVPKKFKENVERYLIAHPELGYTSVREFFVDAVREKMDLNAQLGAAARREVEA